MAFPWTDSPVQAGCESGSPSWSCRKTHCLLCFHLVPTWVLHLYKVCEVNGMEHKDLVQVHTFSTPRKALVAGFSFCCCCCLFFYSFFFNSSIGWQDRANAGSAWVTQMVWELEPMQRPIRFVGNHTDPARQSFLPRRLALKIDQCDGSAELSSGRSKAVGGPEIRGAWLLATPRECAWTGGTVQEHAAAGPCAGPVLLLGFFFLPCFEALLFPRKYFLL